MPARTADIDFTLRRVFKKKQFRPLQREIITAALGGHDVFVQAATSFGKSLCYQLPAVMDHGITLCVTPLLSLMKNQVEALRAAGVAVASVNSGTSRAERDAVLADLRCGHPRTRLLYVTPEYCQTETLRRLLAVVYAQRELARIAVDEAHCVSEWGHDFRSAYLHLDHFRRAFPDTPIMCLTATATPRVRDDVVAVLGLQKDRLRLFSTTTLRPNLHYEVRFYNDEDDGRLDRFVTWLKGIHARRRDDAERRAELDAAATSGGRGGERPEAVSGIVYATMRTECEALAARLRERGIGARPYHAGLPAQDRAECQSRWVANAPGFEVIVATTAFGMGIDKKDVRFVVHWSLPKSFEGFYQEAGRAGRDGRAAVCALYYSREDRDRVLWRLSKEVGSAGLGGGAGGGGGGQMQKKKRAQVESKMGSLQKLIEYCESTEFCRHKLITAYFGEEGGDAETACDFACDRCKDQKLLKEKKKNNLATEEWVSTQRETGALFSDYDPYE